MGYIDDLNNPCDLSSPYVYDKIHEEEHGGINKRDSKEKDCKNKDKHDSKDDSKGLLYFIVFIALIAFGIVGKVSGLGIIMLYIIAMIVFLLIKYLC